MSYKYDVGDLVEIRTDYVKDWHDRYCFNKFDMSCYLGSEATVVERLENQFGNVYHLDVDDAQFFWCEDLLITVESNPEYEQELVNMLANTLGVSKEVANGV